MKGATRAETSMRFGVLFSAAALILLSGSCAAVTVTQLTPKRFVVSTTDLVLDITPESTLQRSVRWLSANDSSLGARFIWTGLSDTFYWTTNPLPQPGGCNMSISRFGWPAAENASISTYDGPNGTAIVETVYSYGPGCKFSIMWFFSDKYVTVPFYGANIPLTPHTVKFSIKVNCPWRNSLNVSNLRPPARSTPYIRGRRMYLDLRLDNTDKISVIPFFADAPGWSSDPSFRDWIENVCVTQNMSAVPPGYRPLPPQYDVTQMTTIIMPYESHTRIFHFLPWAMVDGGNMTRVAAGPTNQTHYLDPDGSVVQSTDIRVQLEFYDNLEYDPTMEFLFADPPTSGTELAASGTNIAAAVAVPVVVVVITAVCISYFLYKRHIMDKETKLVQEKISNMNAGGSKPKPATSASDQNQDSSQRDRTASSWKKARPTSTV